jgi:hypothetical protein
VTAATPLAELTDARRAQLVARAIAARASRARECPHEFFDFTMRSERTRERFREAAQQRLLIDFVMDHRRCVVLQPPGTAKTYTMTALALYLTGTAPEHAFRGAFVSAAEAQAEKPLGMCRDYLEQSFELRCVFPSLRRSRNKGDAWTNSELVVERPPGIRDATIAAFGMDSTRIIGSRLEWVLCDDLLNMGNTATKEQREKVVQWFDSSVYSRLDYGTGRCVVTNTAWHPQDLVHALIERGWPAIRMESEGDIEIYNAPDWDRGYLRPASDTSHLVRLADHDPDPANDVVLWPELLSRDVIEVDRKTLTPVMFARQHKCLCRDDDASLCKSEWIEECKRKARELGVHSFVSKYEGPNPTFTGVDLAFKKGAHNDCTSFFTIEVLPNGLRRILEIDTGQWDAKTVVRKILDKARAYNSIVTVENVAGQDVVRQVALDLDVSLPIKGYTTTVKNKWDVNYGVASLFVEIANGAWLIPNDRHGNVDRMTQRWIEGCLYFTPSKHTPDELMAMFFAREQARQFGVLSGRDLVRGGSVGMTITAR